MKRIFVCILSILISFIFFSCKGTSEPVEEYDIDGTWSKDLGDGLSSEPEIVNVDCSSDYMKITYMSGITPLVTEFTLAALDEDSHHIQAASTSSTPDGYPGRPWITEASGTTFYFTYKIEDNQLWFECSTSGYPLSPIAGTYGPYDLNSGGTG